MGHLYSWVFGRTVPLLLLLSLTALAQAQDDMPLADYRARLAALQSKIGNMTMAQRELAAVKRVRLPDGTQITLDAATFAPPVATADAKGRAKALITLLGARAATPNRSDPKDLARAILAGPEFEEASAAATDDSWLDRTLRDIGDAIRRFFEWLFGGVPSAPQADGSGIAAFLALLLRFLLFVGITLGVVWSGLYVSRIVTAGRAKKRSGVSAPGIDLEEGITDPLGAARELALRGEMRQAVRLAYLACLRRLAGSGLLVLQESRTNWEYQAALRTRSAEAAALFLPATQLFDQVWYGGREATAGEWEQVLVIHNALPSSLVESPAGAKGTSVAPLRSKEGDNAW